VSSYVNYMAGDDSDTRTAPIGSRSTMRTLIDSQLNLTFGPLNLATNYDRGTQKDVPVGATFKNVDWSGYTFWAR